MRRFAALSTFTLALGLVLAACDAGLTGPEAPASEPALEHTAPATTLHRGAVKNFVAPLSGNEVVPPTDTDAQGQAKFKLNKAGDALSFKLNVANIEDVLGAHVHMAPTGENGGIVVFLFGDPFVAPPVTVNGTIAEGTITASDVIGSIAGDFEALIEAMKNGNTYVQVHTTENPGGEVRGQIDRGNGTVSHSAVASQATLTQQFKAVRAATRKYRDIEAARADGYAAVSPYVPGMGFHFAQSLPPFGTDLTDPPVLVYYTNGSYHPAPGAPHDPSHDDDLILGAVEYIVPGDQTASPPNIFADEASPRSLKETEEEGWHFESAEGFTGLHAWVHRGNPAGVFHHTNPNID